MPRAEAWGFYRVCGGQGYLLQGNECHEIEIGDLVILSADANARLRASQLGDMRLCHFGVCAGQLTGFFTAEEQQALSTAAKNQNFVYRIIKREEALAREHAALCDLRQHEPGVLARSAMLSLAVGALREVFISPSKAPAEKGGPEQKFRELIARIPETELVSRPVEDLARGCGCSARHFRRLFQARFGVSLKHRQIQSRIERAKKLLLEMDAKIIGIANQCDFSSLGQFNLTFKRLTKMTPSAWRKAFAVRNAKHRRQHPPACPRKGKSLMLLPTHI
ncbi:MAG: helix-turn-helix transcriptional regulator [Verrucomicrobiota bacterium]